MMLIKHWELKKPAEGGVYAAFFSNTNHTDAREVGVKERNTVFQHKDLTLLFCATLRNAWMVIKDSMELFMMFIKQLYIYLEDSDHFSLSTLNDVLNEIIEYCFIRY